MRIADERVGAVRERDQPGLGALGVDLGRLVDAGASEVEVVARRVVMHLDLVRAGVQMRDPGAVQRQRDREGVTRADGCDQNPRRRWRRGRWWRWRRWRGRWRRCRRWRRS